VTVLLGALVGGYVKFLYDRAAKDAEERVTVN
jgi:hypothetical protein